jgi:hypothetical protein
MMLMIMLPQVESLPVHTGLLSWKEVYRFAVTLPGPPPATHEFGVATEDVRSWRSYSMRIDYHDLHLMMIYRRLVSFSQTPSLDARSSVTVCVWALAVRRTGLYYHMDYIRVVCGRLTVVGGVRVGVGGVQDRTLWVDALGVACSLSSIGNEPVLSWWVCTTKSLGVPTMGQPAILWAKYAQFGDTVGPSLRVRPFFVGPCCARSLDT